MNVQRIAAKEIVDMTRDGRFRWSATIVLTLLTMSLLIGFKHYREIDRQHKDAQVEARFHWDHQGEKNPHAAAHYGMYLFKPKSVLSLLDRGIEPFTGVAIFLEAHKQNAFRNRPARDGTSLQRFGEMTAAMVMQSLVPLVIIFLAFPSFAGEREQGTLRFLLSLGLKPFDLAVGKSIGLSAAIGLIVLPACILGSLALYIEGIGAYSIDARRFTLIVLACLAYHTTFLAIALAASVLGRSATSVLVVLLGFWMFNVMLAPRLAADLCDRIAPLPTAFEFAKAIEMDIKQGIDGHDPAGERLNALKNELLAKYEVETVDELPVNFSGIALNAGEDYSNRVFDKHYGELWAVIDRQDVIAQMLSFLSPTLAVRSLSLAFCGTDNADHLDFSRQAETYRRRLVSSLNKDLIENAGDTGFAYAADGELWKTIPHFDYQPRTAAQAFSGQMIAFTALSAWFLSAIIVLIMATQTVRAD
jgi:ABC-2 type transport system permease protein